MGKGGGAVEPRQEKPMIFAFAVSLIGAVFIGTTLANL